tara:strand:- start:43 stop:609 length:567 start_codon:yes stop_codon:yes gene_type:complete
MTSFVVYEIATGKIVKTGSTSPESLSLQPQDETQAVLEGVASDAHDYVKDGAIVSKGTQPSQGHVFNYETEQWELDIALARSVKWKEVKLERQIRELSTFDWNSHTFQCDEISQIRLQAAVQAATIDDTISMVWTLADNSTETFNATELKQIGKALADHLKVCHDRGRILRGEINAAQNLEELEAVSW